jgi:CheY-like chemotaxis protein
MNPHLILIVEEHRATRALLADQLAADGYEILLAETRQHGLHLLAEHHPQLVLADINGQTLGCSTPCAAATGSPARSTPPRP